MKNLKRFVSAFLLISLLSSLCLVPAMAVGEAETTTEVIYFEDGSYLTVELVVYSNPLARTTYGVSGTKTGEYCNSSGELMWTFSVHGTFHYDGTTATATAASYSYTIEDSAWKFVSGSAYYSGNQATAEGSFKCGLLLNRSTSLTLTCSPDGTLS